MKILAILRAKEFSPNSVEKDQAIMQAVVRRLRSKGYVAELVNEEELTTMQDVPPDTTVLSMGRMSKTLRWLSKQDAHVINSPERSSYARAGKPSAESCMRTVLPSHHRREITAIG